MTEAVTPLEDSSRKDIASTDDPHVFFESFRQSKSYENAYSERLKNLHPSPDIAVDDLKAAFETTEDAKIAMLNFAQKEMHFKYSPSNFDSETKSAIDDYIYSVNFLLKAMREGDVSGGGRMEDKERIIDADAYRSKLHNTLSRVLKEKGYVSSEKLGRTMARIILIDKKLDNFDNASINDLERMRRLIAG